VLKCIFCQNVRLLSLHNKVEDRELGGTLGLQKLFYFDQDSLGRYFIEKRFIIHYVV
jgi:hypothetical protein